MATSNSGILQTPPKLNYTEAARETSLQAFRDIVESRRSVRVFTSDPVPDAVIKECLRLALLAPNSSNLQPWEFYWIKTQTIKDKVVEACLSQSAAKTAQALIVCVARTKTWKQRCRQMLEALEKNAVKTGERTPKSVLQYYRKIAPLAYTQGPLGIIGAMKAIAFFALGFFRAMPREPVSQRGMTLWAVKSTALACENLMLAFRASGFDSCPMEGFDSARVKKILKLQRDASVVMVVGAGKRAVNGIYGAQIRFPSNEFIHEV
ncbi:MAG: nitroreductase family protein [Bacteriovoracaceae bacterium]|nr:nitroreductase family protein [Bacteriovoracaceae bacterium]